MLAKSYPENSPRGLPAGQDVAPFNLVNTRYRCYPHLMMRLPPLLRSRVALGAMLTVTAATLLVTGLVAIFTASGDHGAALPSEGTLEEILQDGAAPGPTAEPSGPPPPPPVRFAIPGIYIDAPVVTLGLGADNYPQVTDRADQVAWYDFSAPPGRVGNAVFSGHVDWQTRSGAPIPGVFYRLRELAVGQPIVVTLEDGTRLQYRITGNVATEYDDPDVVKAMDVTAKDVITVITCGGTWVRDPSKEQGGNYSHRVIVRAERVQDVASSG